MPLKFFSYFIVVAALSGYLYNEQVKIYNDCLPVFDLHMRMYKDGYSYVGTATEERYAKAVQVFINHTTKTFVVIGTDYETLTGCVLLKGIDWNPIIDAYPA